MLHRTLSIAGLIVGLAFASPVSAQQPPDAVPPSFVLEQSGDPSSCFEFACYNHSAFDGDTLAAVGAVQPIVYLWVRDSAGNWSQQATVRHPDPNASTGFGAEIALDGDDLVVTASLSSEVLVYHRSGSAWSYRQTLPGGSASLDLENGILLTTDAVGAFVVYEKGAGGLFRKRATLKLPRFVDGYLSGPVELDSNTAIIAGGDAADGAVFIFQRLFGVWIFAQKLAAPPAAADGGFGAAIAIDRDRIAVGAPNVAGVDETRPGVVQTYARRGLQWRAGELLTNPLPPDGYYRQFGTALDIQGRRLLIGVALTGDPFAPRPPSVYLYELSGQAWNLTTVLDAAGARAIEFSGNSVLVDAYRYRYGTTPIIFDLP